MVTYLHYDRHTLDMNMAMKYPTIVAGADMTGDPEVIQVFQSNDDFAQWADRTKYGEDVRKILDLLHDAVLPQRKNETWIQQMQQFALERTYTNLKDFAKATGHSSIDEEVILKIMGEHTPLTPKMLDPVFLYDREIEREPPTGPPEDSRTQLFIVPSGWWPDLGWVGWNDRARSVRVFGLNVLCENTWFGGRWTWLFGFNGLFNLRYLGFDLITSSVISF